MFHYDSLYQIRKDDDLGSASFWNLRFRDIDLRLNTVESFTARIDTAVSEVETAGLNRINTTLTPYVDALVDRFNELQGQVEDLTDVATVDVASTTATLNGLIAQAQTLVNNLQSLGSVQGGTF